MKDHAARSQAIAVGAAPVAAPRITAQELRFVVLVCRPDALGQKELPLLMHLSKNQVARIQQDVYARLGVHTRQELLFKAVAFGWVACPCKCALAQKDNAPKR